MITIGTRGSPLALAQASEVRMRLAAAHPELGAEGAVATEIIRTTGDRVRDQTLSALGGKGLFTKELDEALLAGSIDIAVHSMKDVPTVLPEGIVIACLLPREDPRDAFFAAAASDFRTLPRGAVVGTASLRRQAQVLHARPDLAVVPLRGNVETRLKKLEDGRIDATILAIAGLKRLGIAERARSVIPPEVMLPAVAQGAIGIAMRAEDARMAAYLAPLDHLGTRVRVAAERAFLAALDGSCKTPIAALAEFDAEGALVLRTEIIRPDGSEALRTRRRGAPDDAAAMGRDAGHELRRRAGPAFFDETLPARTPV